MEKKRMTNHLPSLTAKQRKVLCDSLTPELVKALCASREAERFLDGIERIPSDAKNIKIRITKIAAISIEYEDDDGEPDDKPLPTSITSLLRG
jgi:hypothetical protein